jgi:hypothetical protein
LGAPELFLTTRTASFSNTYHSTTHITATMTSKKGTSKTAAVSAMPAELRSNSGDNTALTHDLPSFGKSVPGDELYETLEDFVFGQSEGEESSDNAGKTEKSGSGDVEQNKVSDGDVEVEEATGSSDSRHESDKTGKQTPPLLVTAQRKRKRRDAYTDDEELVLYLLHNHVPLQHDTRVDVFNRVFHGQGVVREKGALVMQWFRFKDDYKKRYAKLSTAELAEHEAWNRRIDMAMKDAGIASHNDGKQDNDSDSADDQASRIAPPKRPGETRARKKNVDKAMKDAGTASHSDDKQDNDSDGADDPELQLAPPGQRRETRARYTTEHETVMHILRGRKNIDAGTLAEIFNHIFRAEGVVRNKVAIGKHWGRFKDVIQKRFANLNPEESAVYEAWKQEIDDAIEELSG